MGPGDQESRKDHHQDISISGIYAKIGSTYGVLVVL